MAINLPLVMGESGEIRLSDAMFFNWPRVVDRFKNGEWDIIEEMFECSLLVLDDLGAEHDPSRVSVQKLYQILERREYKWTLFTTNIGPTGWEHKFDRRIASRFLRNSRHVSLEDVPDYNTREV